MTTIIRAIQIFNSFQGECVDSGKRMLLIRYKRCNRNCPWCDAQSLMRNSAELETTIGDIQQIIDETNNGLLITGGEPFFNLNKFSTINLINKINALLYNVETNGCELESALKEINKKKNVKFILSPKLFDEKDLVFYFDLVNKLVNDERVYIKLVYENSENNNKFMNYLNEIKFPNERIYLMPEGVTIDQLITNSKIVFDAAEKFKVNFSSRDHIIYNFL
jgi:organic radical activating enzyme